jgi:hypothetical protein
MKKLLPLYIFIDACGWEIIKKRPFGQAVAPLRRRLDSVFGYSSACIPSILSGRWPQDHRNWSYFVYDPQNSPFRSLKSLKWLPKWITCRRKFRRFLSKFLKGPLKFRGYFDLYNIPFEYISMFDFSEKKNPLQPNGLNMGLNIFDYLELSEVPYHVSNPTLSETENFNAALQSIEKEEVDFGFVYWPDLDGLLHLEGNRSSRVDSKLEIYERWIHQLLAKSYDHYEKVNLYIFSDHGMANCDTFIDLKKRIDSLNLKMGTDYAVVYDSTMARFWFFNQHARTEVTALLNQIPEGRIISENELKEMRVYFKDSYFGELFFLLKEGCLIIPSDMGQKPLRGMHGYHPTDMHSYAMLMTNQEELDDEITAIPHIFNLMQKDIERVKAPDKHADSLSMITAEI